MSPRSVSPCPSAQPARLPMLAALGLIAIVVAGMFATMVVTVRSLDADLEGAARARATMTQESLQLERIVVDLETGVRGYMLTDDPRFLEPYQRGREQHRRAPRRARTASARRRCAPRVDAHHARPQRLHRRLHRAADPGAPRPSVLAATTEGKARLDALRARVRRAQPRPAGAHRRAPRRLAGAAPAHAARSPPAAPRSRSRCSSCSAFVPAPLRARARPPRRAAPPSASPTATSTRASRPPARARSASSAPRSTRWPRRSPRATRTCASRPTACTASSTTRRRRSRSRTATAATCSSTTQWRAAMGQVGVDVIGRTDDELFPADVAAAIRVTDLEILRTGEAAEFERDAATGGRAFQLVKFPLKAADGTVYATGTMGTDVSRAPARAGRGGRRLALEVRVPGQHEPRDPHAAERRDRHDRAAARDRPERRSSASTR